MATYQWVYTHSLTESKLMDTKASKPRGVQAELVVKLSLRATLQWKIHHMAPSRLSATPGEIRDTWESETKTLLLLNVGFTWLNKRQSCGGF